MEIEKGSLSSQEYIALLELRDEENRRTIRALSSMLTSAMDRIEELQRSAKRSRRRANVEVKRNASASGGVEPTPSSERFLLDSSDVAELLSVSGSTALKLIKALGGVKVNNRWKLGRAKLDEFISEGRTIDLKNAGENSSQTG